MPARRGRTSTAPRARSVDIDLGTAGQDDRPPLTALPTLPPVRIQRRLIVRGRVQGVWYRDGCQREARRLGVAGWARNLEDGSVEVVAEGDAEVVEQLEQWCRIGPPRAMVTSVESRPSAAEGLLGFRVR